MTLAFYPKLSAPVVSMVFIMSVPLIVSPVLFKYVFDNPGIVVVLIVLIKAFWIRNYVSV